MKTNMTFLAAAMLGLATSGISAEPIPDDDPSILSLGIDGEQQERNMVKAETFVGPSGIKFVLGKKYAGKHGVDLAAFEVGTWPNATDQLMLYGDDDIDIVLTGR